MAWEDRSGTKSRYYYRGERVNGQVRKICYGSGPRAAARAKHDADARAARAMDIAAAQAFEAELEPLERLIVEMNEHVDMLMEASLLAAGFHQHKGQWRRWHGSHDKERASTRASKQQSPDAPTDRPTQSPG